MVRSDATGAIGADCTASQTGLEARGTSSTISVGHLGTFCLTDSIVQENAISIYALTASAGTATDQTERRTGVTLLVGFICSRRTR